MAEKEFKPNLRNVQYRNLKITDIGTEIEISPSSIYDLKTKKFVSTGVPSYKAPLIAVGMNYDTVCLSRKAENCTRCNLSSEFCRAPMKK